MFRISNKKLIRLQKKYKTDAGISKKLKISRQCVQNKRTRFGIPPLPGARTDPPRITEKKLLKLKKTLKSDEAIADKLKITRQAVSYIRQSYGIPAISPQDNSRRNAQIIALHKKGSKGMALAKKYKLSPSQTYRIISGVTSGKNEQFPKRK